MAIMAHLQLLALRAFGSEATGEGVEGEPEATLGGQRGSSHTWCRFCGSLENVSTDPADCTCFKCRWCSVEIDSEAFHKLFDEVSVHFDEAAKLIAGQVLPSMKAMIVTMADVQTAIDSMDSMGLAPSASEISGASYSRLLPGLATTASDACPPRPLGGLLPAAD